MAEAKVKSLEAIESFADSVAKLRHDSGKQVDEIRQQLQRVSNWLEKELPEYWSNEKRIAEARWTEARQDLLRCEAKSRESDKESCSVQKKLLRLATERRSLCEERARLIPKLAMEWNRLLEQTGPTVRQMDDLCETSLQNAWNDLQAIIAALKAYTDQ
jgi:hypothetical protein